jgi:Zn-dependent peptidase ImmA (M78 family)
MSNGKTKHLTSEELWEAADRFRASFMDAGSEPPVDVIFIADVKLRQDIVPLSGLFAEQRMDAALMPDLCGFYVDEGSLMAWEAGSKWVENRLRFSFAHELGHYVLHRDIISGRKFRSFDDFKRWAGSAHDLESAEYQANEFAGRLLVPREILFREYDAYRLKAEHADPAWREIEGMREHIARKIAPRFGVNHQVIEVRFDREGIWPVE